MKRGKTITKWAAMAVSSAALAMPTTVLANASGSTAHELRELNIMLMVTSLRCRNTQHDFRAEYQQFNAAHHHRINSASHSLQRQMQARYGKRGSKRALDKIDVRIANSYGTGHPWLNCAQLKQTARELSAERDVVRLSAAARELLGDAPVQPRTQVAMADTSNVTVQD